MLTTVPPRSIDAVLKIERGQFRGLHHVYLNGTNIETYDDAAVLMARENLATFGKYTAWPPIAVIEADVRIRAAMSRQCWLFSTRWGECESGFLRVLLRPDVLAILADVAERYGAEGVDGVAAVETDLASFVRDRAGCEVTPQLIRVPDLDGAAIADAPVSIEREQVLIDVTNAPQFHGQTLHWRVKGCPFVARPEQVERRGKRVVATFRVGTEGSV